MPIGAEKSFRGVVDLVTMKAHLYEPDGGGRAKVEEIPAELAEAAKNAHETLVEMVAEGDDELMEEFFEKGTLPVEDLKKGLREAVVRAADVPGAGLGGLHNIGSESLLDFLAEAFPASGASAVRQSPTANRTGREQRSKRQGGWTRSRCPCSFSRRWPTPSPGGSAISR